MGFTNSNIDLYREDNGNLGWGPVNSAVARRVVDATNLPAELRTLGVPSVIKQSGYPLCIPPGNGSTTGLQWTNTAGAFSLTTTLFPMIYSGGIWLWIPVNGFTASTPAAAGFYWATGSSTSVGLCTGVTMASTGGAVPTAARIAAAPAVTTLNRWLTQQTTVVAAAVTATIPANTMGASGKLRTELLTSYNNSAGAKTISLNFGGTAVLTQAPTTTTGARYNNTVSNRGVARQVYPTATMATAYTESVDVATVNLTMGINTAADVAVTVDMTIAANTDIHILESYCVEVVPGA